MPALTRSSAQAGIALLESLIAIAILASALLGMLFVQLRTLADAQSTMHRAQALQLIEDLSERIQSNPGGFARLADYRSAWGPVSSDAPDCEAQWCGAAALAQWDLQAWKGRVARSLPLGDATVFDLPDLAPGDARRVLGVMIGWRAAQQEQATPLVPGIACPAALVCHLGHVQP